jgi:imidazolonepropionase-like amidohydrolase
MQSIAADAQPIAIRFGILYDMIGEPKKNGILVIEGERISTIGDADTPIPAGATVIEAPCVVPGLINAHVHLEMSAEPSTMTVFVLTTPTQRAFVCADNARKALESGVTTVRDLGSTEKLAIELRDAITAGRAVGPNIIAAGRAICMTGGHGWFIGREADGPLGTRIAVREQLRDGAQCIKFIATGGVLTKGAVPGISQLDEDELRAGIDEAHRHGMKCAAHAIGAEGTKNAIRAGIDSIEHGHLIDEEGVRLLVERGTYLVPTLSAIERIVENGNDAGMPAFVIEKARAITLAAAENLRRVRDAGGRFAAGSDAGTPFNPHDGFARELELMQQWLGMSSHDTLRAATVSAADLLDVERGSLAAGAVADLTLLAADITSDRRPYREPIAVIKNGRLVTRR